jgi:hypothetical protein
LSRVVLLFTVAASDQEKGKPTPRQTERRKQDGADAKRPVPPVPAKIPEGGDANLRRRAEWLRQRHGQR